MASDAFTGTNGDALSASWTGVSTALPKTDLSIQANCAACAAWADGAVYHSSAVDDSQAVIKAVATGARAMMLSKHVCVRAGTDTLGYSVCLGALGATGDEMDYLIVQKNGGGIPTDPIYRALSSNLLCTADHTLRITASGTSTTTLTVYCDGSQVGAVIEDSATPITSGHPGLWWGEQGGTLSNSYIDDWTDNASAASAYPIALYAQQ